MDTLSRQGLPNSLHVRDVELASSGDIKVWEYAKQHNLVIVSKDSDFHQRSFLFGAPPKVIWIQRGNCSTKEIETILRQHKTDLENFEQDKQSALLELS